LIQVRLIDISRQRYDCICGPGSFGRKAIEIFSPTV